MRCDIEWMGPFWGGEPGVDELHVCDENDGRDGRHKCSCGESTDPQNGDRT